MTDDCPFCQAKEVNDKGLFAFLLNELGIDREEAQEAFQAKYQGRQRKMYPLEERKYSQGYEAALKIQGNL
jgi:hypothetical protein